MLCCAASDKGKKHNTSSTTGRRLIIGESPGERNASVPHLRSNSFCIGRLPLALALIRFGRINVRLNVDVMVDGDLPFAIAFRHHL